MKVPVVKSRDRMVRIRSMTMSRMGGWIWRLWVMMTMIVVKRTKSIPLSIRRRDKVDGFRYSRLGVLDERCWGGGMRVPPIGNVGEDESNAECKQNGRIGSLEAKKLSNKKCREYRKDKGLDDEVTA